MNTTSFAFSDLLAFSQGLGHLKEEYSGKGKCCL